MIVLEKNGFRKKVSTGFSWKLVLFGLMYPAARGDWKGFFVMFLLFWITFGFIIFVCPFTYNRAYIKRLISDGWKPGSERTVHYLKKRFKYAS